MKAQAFVSMPFGNKSGSVDNEWTRLFDYGISPLGEKLGAVEGYEPITLVRADRDLRDLALKTNVKKLIDQSTFVIAVLTTTVVKSGGSDLRLSNPNVLWELGYAEAQDKPIVVLADNESLRALPVLAGVPNVCIYPHQLVQAADAKRAPDALSGIARDLAPYVSKACQDAKRGQGHADRTRAHAYPNRDVIDLATLIAGAQKDVDVLTTNVSYFLFSRLTPNGWKAQPFAKALQGGATVRIVTMDPESVIAEYRAKQLGRGDNVPGYRQELRDGIIQLYDVFGQIDRFHLRIYNDLPLQITTRVDEKIITSVVTRGEQARKRIQIEFNLYDEGVTDSFVTHFQSMFEDSKDVRGVAWVLRHAEMSSQPKSKRVQEVGLLPERDATPIKKPRIKTVR